MFGDPYGEFEQDQFFYSGVAAIPFGSHRQHRARSVPGHPDVYQQQHQLQHQRRHQQSRQDRRQPGSSGSAGDALVPISRNGSSVLPGFTFGTPQFDRLFESVQRMMSEAGSRMLAAQEASKRPDFDGQIYSHSSVYAYRSDGSGDPQVYQAVSESRAGPGGVRETRKALKDSRSREERVAVGHHIGGRGHTVERRRNTGNGEQQENHQYEGIDESEGNQFDREWDARAARISFNSGGGGRSGLGGRPRQQRAITDGRH